MKKRSKLLLVFVIIIGIMIGLTYIYHIINNDSKYLDKINESLKNDSVSIEIVDSEVIVRLKNSLEAIEKSNMGVKDHEILIKTIINDFKKDFSDNSRSEEIIKSLNKLKKLDEKIRYVDSLIIK